MILKHMLDQLERDADLDRVFRALADPGRRVMQERLSRGPAQGGGVDRAPADTLKDQPREGQ